ncbi:unnamed protein product [Prorocentrum cordatum]|uniref:Uncharacterized protein n=1 Tax=Prorocentrum cordatum TaxID=2364126 RepID=A0ABN9VH48_9DINO|nr:unnamed protein product [Polarella glacialis]
MRLAGVRGEEISSVLGNVGCILFQGSERRNLDGEPRHLVQHSYQYEVSFGFSRSSKRADGTSTMLHNLVFPRCCIRKIIVQPTELLLKTARQHAQQLCDLGSAEWSSVVVPADLLFIVNYRAAGLKYAETAAVQESKATFGPLFV